MSQPPARQSATDLLLRKLERFAPLSAVLRTALSALAVRVQDYARGQLIASQGESPDESAFVLEGMVFRFKLLPDGGRQILSMQLPGDFTDPHDFVIKPLDHAIAAGSGRQAP